MEQANIRDVIPVKCFIGILQGSRLLRHDASFVCYSLTATAAKPPPIVRADLGLKSTVDSVGSLSRSRQG